MSWPHALHEFAFRTLFRAAAASGLHGQSLVYRAYFGWLYRRPDPWQYHTSPYELTKYERTLEVLDGTVATRALEAGCGEGMFTEMMMQRGVCKAVVGVDVSPAALARARVRCVAYPHATFVRANLASHAPAGPFDLIVCAETLYYIGPRSVSACRVLTERLALGGRIVAVHPADRADMLHAPWADDPDLVRDQRVAVDDTERPYVIDVFRRVRDKKLINQ